MLDIGGIEEELLKQGINLDKEIIEYEKDAATQCFATGKYAGYSVGDLIEYYCRIVGKIHKRKIEDESSGL